MFISILQIIKRIMISAYIFNCLLLNKVNCFLIKILIQKGIHQFVSCCQILNLVESQSFIIFKGFKQILSIGLFIYLLVEVLHERFQTNFCQPCTVNLMCYPGRSPMLNKNIFILLSPFPLRKRNMLKQLKVFQIWRFLFLFDIFTL
jgi:hypothetical protein